MVPLLLFSALVIYNNFNGEVEAVDKQMAPVFLYVPGILLIIAFPTSSFIFKKYIRNSLASNETDLRGKIALYQTANLIRMAFFEVAGMFALVSAFLTGNNYLLIVVAIVVTMYLILLPSPSKIAMDLELSGEEREEISGG